MKEILKVLKSMQFWLAAITIVVTAIAAWPVVEKWMVEDPVVYIGDGIELKPDKQIVLNYILSDNHKEKKAVVPLPVGFANENGTSLDKFFITAKAKAKGTSDNGWMQRLLPYGYYLAQSVQKNGLLQNNSVSYNSGMQTIGNPDNGIDFASKTKYENILALNFAGEDEAKVWDEFSFSLTTGANNCDTKEYKFVVRCYFTDNVENKKREVLNEKRTNEQWFLITPNYCFTIINQDSLKISVFEIDDKTNVIKM